MTAAPFAAARAIEAAFPTLTERFGRDEIVTLVHDALARANDEPRLVVRLAAADYEAVAPELSEIADRIGYPGKIISIEDETVAEGDARVEWADGGLASNAGRTAAAIQAAFEELSLDPDQAGAATPVSDEPQQDATGA